MESINLFIWSGQPIFIEGIKNILNREIFLNIFEYDENNLNSKIEIRQNVFNFILIDDVCFDKNSILNFVTSLSRNSKCPKTIICTNYEEADYLKKLKNLGVKGFIHLGSKLTTLPLILNLINKGELYCDQKLKSLLFKPIIIDNPDDFTKEVLTNREKEILLLLSKGMKNIEIAKELFLSIHTIEAHKSHMIEKLRLNGASELLKYAIGLKL